LTLVELMAAMAIFSILMAMVSAAMLGGMNSIRHLSQKSEEQTRWMQTSETISRMLRYASNPELAKASIVWASPTSLRFYSSSGISGSNDRPNLIDVRYTASTGLVTLMVYPLPRNPDIDANVSTADAWKYPTWEKSSWAVVEPSTSAYTRTLMKAPTAASPMAFSIRVRCNKPPCPTRPDNGDITPTIEGVPPITVGEYYDSVLMSIGDAADDANRITQQVRLPNLHPLPKA
jgi:prepilin-type N-terminal cleavage/methylation domain-containing protein